MMLKKPYLILAAALFSLLSFASGHAQNPIGMAQSLRASSYPEDANKPQLYPGSEIHFFNYTAEQGLSMSVVNAIAQDQQGFLWFGTQDGLNRFDGTQFKVFKHDPEDPNSLSANYVNALYADTNGLMWIGTEGGGLDRYNPADGSFTHFLSDPEEPQSISSNYVLDIYEDQANLIWLVTRDGIDQFNRRTGKFSHWHRTTLAPEPLKSGKATTITQDLQGDYWFTSEEGLLRFSPATYSYSEFRHNEQDQTSIRHDSVNAVLADSSGNLWVGTENGLDLLNGDRKTFSHVPLEPAASNITGNIYIKYIKEAPGGALWIGTWGNGLIFFDPETGASLAFRNQYGNPSSLSGNYIVDIFYDRSGSAWVGTFGGGLSKFDSAALSFSHYIANPNNPNSLTSSLVWSVLPDGEFVWIGTDRGLDRLERSSGQFTHYTHDPLDDSSLSGNAVYAIYRDSQGTLWVGTDCGGLNRLSEDGTGFTHYKYEVENTVSLSADMISGILEDDDHNLWIGTGKGLNRYNSSTQTFDRFTHSKDDYDTLDNEFVMTVSRGSDGIFWVGTHIGINRFDPRTGKAKRIALLDENGNAIDEITPLSILEDSSGNIWIGTSGKGLLLLDPSNGRVRSFTEQDGMPNDTAYGILEDETGSLWISTNNGLTHFDPHTEQFWTYSSKDGVQGSEFNSFAYAKSPQGEMFFGGINGLTAFYPSSIQTNDYLPPVALKAIRISGDSTDPQPIFNDQGMIVLRHPHDSFDFEFAGLSYVQPEQNQYAYRLDGFDLDWNYLGSKNFGRYTNLPGGDYNLQLKAANSSGLWNEKGLTIPVKVIPPFWETSWFVLAALLVGGGMVYAGYRYRLQSILSRSRHLEVQVKERTSEIERRRQELEALYRADEALYRNLQLDQVLQALVESAVGLLHADKGALLVLDKEKHCLTARVTYGFKPETVQSLSFELGEGIAGIVAQTGEPLITQDASLDSRVPKRIQDAEGIHSIMLVPIKVAGEVFGVFSADFIQPHTFGNDELRLLMSFAQRAGLAIQNAQLYEQTQEQAVVEERNRLARELHDAVTQTLFSASLIAEALPKSFETNPIEAHELLDELRQLNRGALAEMRTLLLELRPTALEETNLEDLLKQLGEAAAGREGIPVVVHTNNHFDLSPEVHITLYRIAQEALNNALKHSRCHSIHIELDKTLSPSQYADQADGEEVKLSVYDDGCGFDQTNTPSDHLGLKIMRERAQAIGAKFDIKTAPGEGTRLTVLWKK